MTVDRQARDNLRNALLGYFQGYISNEILMWATYELHDRNGIKRIDPDLSLYAISIAIILAFGGDYDTYLWTHPVPLKANEEIHNFIMRMLAFLRTNEDIAPVLMMAEEKKICKRILSNTYWKKHRDYWPYSGMEEVAKRRDEIADLSPDFQMEGVAEYFAKIEADKIFVRKALLWGLVAIEIVLFLALLIYLSK